MDESIRRDLKFDDAESTTCLPNDTIFAELARTSLQQQVLDLEEAKIAQSKEIAKLKKRVKKLEKRRKSRPAGLRRLKKVGSSKQVESSKEKDSLDIDLDAKIALVDESQRRMHDADMFGVDNLKGNEVFLEVREKSVEKEISTADPVTTAASVEDSTTPTTTTTADVDDELTLTKTLIAIKAAKPKKLAEQEQAKVANDDTGELKRCLEIVPEDDDVAIEATPLSSKSPTINFNREDLEVLRSIVKERFKKTKPVDDMENLLFQTLKTMFEPHVNAAYVQLVLLVYKVAAVFNKVNASKSRVTTAVRVSTTGWIKWLKDQDMQVRSITTWEDLTTRFLAQFFPPGRTAKLRNDILMFQQQHRESLSEAWTRFKNLLQKVPHHGIDLWLQV
nr:zinc finger, CCHC-type [Tanacetum cinerariifolium]